MHTADARFVRSPTPLTLVLLVLATAPALMAQKKSVRPGINKSFPRPNVQEFVGRFETESREVFERRREIIAALSLRHGQSVADVGAGTGLFSRLLAPGVGSRGRVKETPRVRPYPPLGRCAPPRARSCRIPDQSRRWSLEIKSWDTRRMPGRS